MARKPIRKTETTSPISPTMIVIIVVGALLIVGGLILLGNPSLFQSEEEFEVSGYPSLGPSDAPVTLIEFSDFGCGHCRNFKLNTFPRLKEQFIETGQIQYVSYPFYLGSAETGLAAEAAWCASDQGRYFEYQQALFEAWPEIADEGEFDPAGLVEVADEIDLDEEALARCIANGTHRVELEEARQAVANRITATPTFFVNKQRVSGNVPYSTFEQIINQELAMAQ